MESNMTIYILPAAIALMIKLAVLYVSRNSSRSGSKDSKVQSSLFFTMVLVFACHNVAEILGFLEYFNGERLTQVLRWYYVMTVLAMAAMLLYAGQVGKIHQKSKALRYVVVSVALALSLLIVVTDSIVAGSHSLGYVMTAVQGNYYWMFQASALLSFAAITWLLVSGYRKTNDHLIEIQCSYTLLALSPILIASVLILFLMAIGVNVNAAALLPIATTAFLVITLKSESQHKLTDIRRHIPRSLERQTGRHIMEIFSRYAQDQVNYRDSLAEIEKLLVMHKHRKNDGNVSTTAANMDIPRSSLYSIFRRLEIEHNDKR